MSGQAGGVHGRLGAAQRQLARRHRPGAHRDGEDQGRAAHRHAGAIAFDSTKYIDNAIHEVRETLIETICIVIVVIFLFLGSLRTVLVPVVAIPVSLIGAIFLMQVLGFTLNLLTLLAIVLSVGLVVDDAIVVVENVERHIREGKTPMQAALRGGARAGRPDHRHDHHAGGGVHAHRLPGRADRRAVPRVRVHAGGRGAHLGRRGADAVADDVVACWRDSTGTGRFTSLVDRAFERRADAATPRMLATTLANRPAVYAVWVGAVAADGADVHVLAARSWRPPRTRAWCSAPSTCPPTPPWSS